MEKQINDLSIFTDYQNRQVILNFYEDEDLLWKRDGFHFQNIQLASDQLLFSMADGSEYTVLLEDYPKRYINSDFQHYYVLRNGSNRLEIYFP